MDLRRPRRIAVVGLLAACLLVVVSSGAFSSTEAERNVTVDVVGDEDAYMSLEYSSKDIDLSDETSVPATENQTYLTARNQFAEPVDVTVSPSTETVANNLSVSATTTTKEGIDSGQSKDFEAEIKCKTRFNDTRTAKMSFDVSANSNNNDVTVEADATGELRTVKFRVDCPNKNG